jgi:hypothetical protein
MAPVESSMLWIFMILKVNTGGGQEDKLSCPPGTDRIEDHFEVNG